MDIENRVIEKLKKLGPTITEELLINLSNKGTLNRGKKDLEKQKDALTFLSEEEKIEVKLGEEAVVTLSDTVADCKCSCPSTSICRHIITALLFVKQIYEEKGDVGGEEEERKQTKKEDFKELNGLLEEEIQKIVGKKEYASLLLSVRKRNEAEFVYRDMLQVTLKSQSAVVYFPVENSIEGALCSCKDRGLCRHKKYALLAYLMAEHKMELTLPEENRELGDKEKEFLKQGKEQLAFYLEKGMASLTEEVIKEAERNYIRAYGMKLFDLATEYKSLASDLASYFAKNVSFSNTRTMHTICRIYNRMDALLIADGEKRNTLIGKRKEESFQLEEMEITGLGAQGKITKRGDLLISAYFYSKDLKEIVLLSTMRPIEKDTKYLMKYLYQMPLIWEDEFSFHQICSNKLKVKQAIITSGRISGTKNTKATILERTKEEDLKEIAYKDYKELREELKKHTYQYFAPYQESDRIYLIELYDIGMVSYNNIKQRLEISVFDQTGEEVVFEMRYNKLTEPIIATLEDDKKRPKFRYLLGNFFEQKGKLHATYLSGMTEDGTVCNLYFSI